NGQGAECHADAELGAPLVHKVAESAVQTDGCQEQGERAEESGQCSEEAFLDERIIDLLREGMKFERNGFVQLGDCILNRDGEARGGRGGAKLEVLWFKAFRYLGNGGESSRVRVFAERFVLGVFDESNDLDQRLGLTGVGRGREARCD